MNRKLKDALIFVAIAWPVMMVTAYLLGSAGAFADTDLLAFGLVGFPALFIARLVTLQFTDRPRT